MSSVSAVNNISDQELEKMDINDIQNIMMRYDQAMMENEQRGRRADQNTQMRHGYGGAFERAQTLNRTLAQMKQNIWDRWHRLQKKKPDEDKKSDF